MPGPAHSSGPGIYQLGSMYYAVSFPGPNATNAVSDVSEHHQARAMLVAGESLLHTTGSRKRSLVIHESAGQDSHTKLATAYTVGYLGERRNS